MEAEGDAHVQALHDFQGGENQLSFRRGDIIRIELDDGTEEWLFGSLVLSQEHGPISPGSQKEPQVFPLAYVQPIDWTPPAVYVQAAADFQGDPAHSQMSFHAGASAAPPALICMPRCGVRGCD